MIEFPNGLKIQWGVEDSSKQSEAISKRINFLSTYKTIPQIFITGIGDYMYSTAGTYNQVQNITSTYFEFPNFSNVVHEKYQWLAIGY